MEAKAHLLRPRLLGCRRVRGVRGCRGPECLPVRAPWTGSSGVSGAALKQNHSPPSRVTQFGKLRGCAGGQVICVRFESGFLGAWARPVQHRPGRRQPELRPAACTFSSLTSCSGPCEGSGSRRRGHLLAVAGGWKEAAPSSGTQMGRFWGDAQDCGPPWEQDASRAWHRKLCPRGSPRWAPRCPDPRRGRLPRGPLPLTVEARGVGTGSALDAVGARGLPHAPVTCWAAEAAHESLGGRRPSPLHLRFAPGPSAPGDDKQAHPAGLGGPEWQLG